MRLCVNVQQNGEQSGFETDLQTQDRILSLAAKAAGMPLNTQVGIDQIKDVIVIFERIIIANSKFGQRPDSERHFRAVVEFYKYLRGDARIFQFYRATKQQVTNYAIDWLYGSGIENYKKLALSFVAFLLKFFPDLEYADFVGQDVVPDGFKMKFQIEENQYRDLLSKTNEAYDGMLQMRVAIRNDFNILKVSAEKSADVVSRFQEDNQQL